MDSADIYEAESTGVSNSLHVEVRERPEPRKTPKFLIWTVWYQYVWNVCEITHIAIFTRQLCKRF